MEYTRLGNSGLEVSRICLGCMGFGKKDAKWAQSEWVVEQEQADEVIKFALDNGINFFDTANIYSHGTSEQVLGNAIRKYANRDDVVVATKVFFTKETTPNQMGLSRKAIFREIDKSLANLQMDYVDLLIIHRFDSNTPIEETMKALHDLVESGKVRYIGASAMYGWQFQKAQYVAEKNGWTKFISMQNHYNLLYREDERDLIPVCDDQNVGLTPYSPLAGGRLARMWDSDSIRSKSDKVGVAKYDKHKENDIHLVERVKELANKYEVSQAQIALAWLLSKPNVASPIIGSTKVANLEDGIKSLNVKLAPEDIDYLEQLYYPREIVGALS